jgi:trehalose-phosphatase
VTGPLQPELALPIDDYLTEVESRILSAPSLVLELDFDGTLAPIVPTPAAARMPDSTRELLAELAAEPGITVVLLSGRSLADIQDKVDVPNVVYGGNHGMEIWREDGLSFTESAAAAARGELSRVTAALSRSLEPIEGVEVEDKGLTSSVHYRRVNKRHHAGVVDAVARAVAETGGRLRLTKGSMVAEIRPDVEWNKGAAARWIQHQLGGSALPIYIGDDTTDEDAFTALTDGITIRVGCGIPTFARYCIPSVEEVPTFLRWLASTFRRKDPHA